MHVWHQAWQLGKSGKRVARLWRLCSLLALCLFHGHHLRSRLRLRLPWVGPIPYGKQGSLEPAVLAKGTEYDVMTRNSRETAASVGINKTTQ